MTFVRQHSMARTLGLSGIFTGFRGGDPGTSSPTCTEILLMRKQKWIAASRPLNPVALPVLLTL